MQLYFSFSSTINRIKNLSRRNFARFLFLGVFFVIEGLFPLHAEIFRFKFNDGDTYRINSTVTEDVYLNGVFAHQAYISYRGSFGRSTGIGRKICLRTPYLHVYDERTKQ